MPRRPLRPEDLEQHLDRLYRAALGLTGRREDAEDLVQETCARVLRRPRLIESGDALPYLLRTLRNAWANELRTRSRRIAPGDADPELASAPEARGPEARLAASEVLAAIARLPPDQREALVLVDVCGLSYAEVGAMTGVPEATVATRLFRARRRVAGDAG